MASAARTGGPRLGAELDEGATQRAARDTISYAIFTGANMLMIIILVIVIVIVVMITIIIIMMIIIINITITMLYNHKHNNIRIRRGRPGQPQASEGVSTFHKGGCSGNRV